MASSFDIQVVKGAGLYEHEFVASGDGSFLDLNGYDLSGYVKFRHGSTKILLDLEPEPIPGGASEGYFAINLNAAELTIPFGSFVYYIDAHSGDSHYSLYKGKFEVLSQEQDATPGGFFPPGAATTNWVTENFYPRTSNPAGYVTTSQMGICDCNYSGVIDGINTVFYTPSEFVTDSVCTHINGIRQSRRAGDYWESGNNAIVFSEALQSDDTLIIDYMSAA